MKMRPRAPARMELPAMAMAKGPHKIVKQTPMRNAKTAGFLPYTMGSSALGEA
jgi:hypothetical protein